MALTLHLLRHAKSSWSEAGQEDHERPLNGRGRRAAKLMGRFLAGEGPAPARVLCSSAVRTRETWQRMQDCLESKPEVSYQRSLYLASAEEMLERIHSEPDAACLLVIGHNPGTEELARLLAGSGDEEAWHRLRDKFPTAALATLAFDAERWSELSPAAGRLLSFVTPGDLDSHGERP